MGYSRLETDVHIAGHLSANSMTVPTGTITNAMVNGSAGILATKLQHQHMQAYSQESDTTSAAEDYVMHVVYGTAGSAVAFEAGSVTLCTGTATITVDLHNNGASILTTPIVLDSANTVYIAEAGAIDTATLADGDVLEVVVTVAAGDGAIGKGVFASLIIREDAA